MGIAIFIALTFFGGIFWPILIGAIELVCCLIGSLINNLASDDKPKATRSPAHTEKAKKPAPEKEEEKELPFEQKVIFCSNIIDDSYSYKDEILDELYEGNDSPIFSVPDCLKYSERDFQDQFGGQRWNEAWQEALALCFGIPFKDLGKGCFVGENTQ